MDPTRKTSEVEEVGDEGGRQTPSIHQQPPCFRIGTPFPLPSESGGVIVSGVHSTEIGFAFPPLNVGGSSVPRRNDLPENVWPKGYPFRTGREDERGEAKTHLLTGSIGEVPRTERMLSPSACDVHDGEPVVSPKGRDVDANRAFGSLQCGGALEKSAANPCADRFARLSLDVVESDTLGPSDGNPVIAGEAPDGSDTELRSGSVDDAQTKAEIGKKDEEISQAKREIEVRINIQMDMHSVPAVSGAEGPC